MGCTLGADRRGGAHAADELPDADGTGTTLFYGWGFGLWNRVGPAAGLLLAFVIFFGLQVPWSLWWLKRHEQGPLEWLWSRLTYGRPLASTPAQLRISVQ